MEKELIMKAKAGSKSAFEELIKLYLPKLYKVAYFFLYNGESAADICQDTFLKAYNNLNRFNESRAFYPWLYTILKNLCINHKKRTARTKPSDQDIETLRSSYANPEEELLKKDQANHLVKAVANLPEMYREILVLKVYNNLSYSDIARVLNIPKGTVMSRLYNARLRLKSVLSERKE